MTRTPLTSSPCSEEVIPTTGPGRTPVISQSFAQVQTFCNDDWDGHWFEGIFKQDDPNFTDSTRRKGVKIEFLGHWNISIRKSQFLDILKNFRIDSFIRQFWSWSMFPVQLTSSIRYHERRTCRALCRRSSSLSVMTNL